ncbi:MAG: hypothetical protein IMW86_02110 [Hydrogenibacillus sp.]|nr:hypothetical protein [Hydrogenibacillus sp.]
MRLAEGAALSAPIWERFEVKYVLIVVLLFIAFRLGFERPLPLLKRFIVYAALVVGAFPLIILSYGLPIEGTLIVTVLVLVAYRLRRRVQNRS